MELEYFKFNEKPIKAIELMKLYKDAGWWEERKEQDIEEMLKREISIGVWKEGTLIGVCKGYNGRKF